MRVNPSKVPSVAATLSIPAETAMAIPFWGSSVASPWSVMLWGSGDMEFMVVTESRRDSV